jgi:hypothetical protein
MKRIINKKKKILSKNQTQEMEAKLRNINGTKL